MKKLTLFLFGMIFLMSLVSATNFTFTTNWGTATGSSLAAMQGVKFYVNTTFDLNNATKQSVAADTNAYLMWASNGTQIANVSFSGDLATFGSETKGLPSGSYYLLADRVGSARDQVRNNSAIFPYNTTIGVGNTGFSLTTGIHYGTSNNTAVGFIWKDIGYGISYPNVITTSVSLTYPTNNSNIFGTNTYLNASYNVTTSNANWTNATYSIWFLNGTLVNSTTISLDGSADTSSALLFENFPFANNYTWNVNACYTNSTFDNCTLSTNSTFNIKAFQFNSQAYTNPTTETLTGNFIANISLATGVSISNASLLWNGTTYGGFTNTTGVNKILYRSLTIPQVTSQTNISFVWNIYYTLPNSTLITENITTLATQTINTLDVDNCVINTIPIVNLTIYDEDSLTFLPNSTWNTTSNVYVKLSGDFTGDTYEYYSGSIVTNPIGICINSSLATGQNYRLDLEIQYQADDYVTEYYYIENFTLNTSVNPKNVSLYLLLTNRSQEFLITFKDTNLIPVEGALIQLTRQYLSLGQFINVEVSKTDNDGNTIGHFVLNDEIYTLYVIKDGELLATYENVRAFCSDIVTGDCRINLNQISTTSNPSEFLNNLGVIGSQTYNDTTKVYTFEYTTNDSSSKVVNVTIYKYDEFLNTTICTQTLISSSGTLTCTIPSAYYNDTAFVRILVDGEEYSTTIFNIQIGRSAELNAGRYFLAFLLVITIPLLAITSGPMTLVLFIVGLVMAGGLTLLDWGGFIGPFSAFLWFVIAAIVLLMKAKSRREQA